MLIQRLGPLVLVCLFSLAGCSEYVVPQGGVNLDRALKGDAPARVGVRAYDEASDESPLADRSKTQAGFPAHIAVARIQQSGYRSRTNLGYGSGDYSVITTRDIERQEDFDRLTALDQLAQVAPINRLLLPEQLVTEKPLRQAARRLHADMLLIYTIDTAFFKRDQSTPLTAISLGLSPTVKIRAVTTISALLLDAHTGYLYAALETTDRQRQGTSRLGSKDACDALRLETERQAFEKLVDDFERAWPMVVAEYSSGRARANAAMQGAVYLTRD